MWLRVRVGSPKLACGVGVPIEETIYRRRMGSCNRLCELPRPLFGTLYYSTEQD